MAANDFLQEKMADDGKLVVPVITEEIQVAKRRVDTGRGVRIHKSVSEQPHLIDETLLHDALDVRRVKVDKIVPLHEAPVARQEGDTLIVPVVEEVLVVEKRLRIKEEIHITRTQSEQVHTESHMLRTEQVSIERFDDGSPDPALQSHLELHSTTRR